MTAKQLYYRTKLRQRILAKLRPLGCQPKMRIALSTDQLGSHDLRIIRQGEALRLEVHPFAFKRPARAPMQRYAATWVHWFLQAPSSVNSIVGEVSDGQFPTCAGFSFSSFTDGIALVPDAHFFEERGYEATRQFMASQNTAWHDRSDDLVWRGRLNNTGVASDAPSALNAPWAQQRLRMVLACQDLDVDFKFVAGNPTEYEPWLHARGYIADPIAQNSWAQRKFAIVIDGFSNAWSACFKAMLMGCCVLRVDSPHGYEQWYYDQLRPYEHYVPIRADLSDLDTQINWIRQNDDQARAIAAAGQRVVNAMTWDSECKRVGQIIAAKAGTA